MFINQLIYQDIKPQKLKFKDFTKNMNKINSKMDIINQVDSQSSFNSYDNSNYSSGELSPINSQSSPDYIIENKKQERLALYSTSGFNLLDVLARVITRPNPQITLGPVDMSCAFLVSDAKQPDLPIVYASESFENLTGYKAPEILGRNCRFLQSPDGLVSLGSIRKYTNNNIVKDVKASMISARELQVQIVNYKKDGRPFLNLMTIIPITVAGDIRYFVGFQCDLVETPSMIIENMKNGTFGVCYSKPKIYQTLDQNKHQQPYMPYCLPYSSCQEAYEVITGKPKNEESSKDWSQMLLDKSVDFIHAISLKGLFLYASPSSKKLLGYNNNDLIGTNLADICHPSDVASLMRDIKDSNNNSTTNVIFRVKHKTDGYLWMESVGQLHNESTSSKKYIVLSGRLRPIFNLTTKALELDGGVRENEFWTKLSLDGLFLYSTKGSLTSLGYLNSDLIGSSFYKIIKADKTSVLSKAISDSSKGISNRIRLTIQNKKGHNKLFDCSFFPGYQSSAPEFILCKLVQAKETFVNDYYTPPSSNAPSPLGIENIKEDDIFKFLGEDSKTTWNYELNQLKIQNKKLKEEILQIESENHLGKKRKLNGEYRVCLNCGADSTPEWRRGPSGPKTLCNSCGLKYSKTVSVKPKFTE